MVSLGDVKRSAATLYAQGQHLAALRLYDAIVAATPLDYDARIRVADCALVEAADSESFEPGSAWNILYVPADAAEPTGAGESWTSMFDKNPVYDLLAEACP